MSGRVQCRTVQPAWKHVGRPALKANGLVCTVDAKMCLLQPSTSIPQSENTHSANLELITPKTEPPQNRKYKVTVEEVPEQDVDDKRKVAGTDSEKAEEREEHARQASK